VVWPLERAHAGPQSHARAFEVYKIIETLGEGAKMEVTKILGESPKNSHGRCDHIFERKSFYEILNLKTFYLFSEIGGQGGHRILLYYFLLLYFQNSKRI
jgi:hypothetical protein